MSLLTVSPQCICSFSFRGCIYVYRTIRYWIFLLHRFYCGCVEFFFSLINSNSEFVGGIPSSNLCADTLAKFAITSYHVLRVYESCPLFLQKKKRNNCK